MGVASICVAACFWLLDRKLRAREWSAHDHRERSIVFENVSKFYGEVLV